MISYTDVEECMFLTMLEEYTKWDHDLCTQGIHSQVAIDTLNQPSINTWSMCWLTLGRHLSQTLVESPLIFAVMPLNIDLYIWVSWHSAVYWPTLDQVSITCWSRCWASVDQDIDQVLIKDRSMVSVNTLLQMPLVHTIHKMFINQLPLVGDL